MSKSLRLHIGPEYAEMPWRKPQAIEPLPEAFVYVSGKNTFHPVGKCHQVRFASVDLDFLVHMNVDQPVDPHTYVVTDALTSTPCGFGTTPEQAISRAGHYLGAISQRGIARKIMSKVVNDDVPFNPTVLADLSGDDHDHPASFVVELTCEIETI